MERLSDTAIDIINELHTERLDYYSEYIPLIDAANSLAAYEDTGLEPEDLKKAFDETAILKLAAQALSTTSDHLRDLLQAEQAGRLVLLPCKVGDTVYEPNKRGFISIYKVISIHLSTCSILVGWELIDGIYSNVNGFEASALGKTVFLTREDAEAAMAQEGGKDHA